METLAVDTTSTLSCSPDCSSCDSASSAVTNDGTQFDEFIFIALENASDVQKLKSMEFTMIFINEAREVALRFDTCKERGRFTLDPLTGLSAVVHMRDFDSKPTG